MIKINEEQANSFLNLLDERFGIYLDTVHGFDLNVKEMIEWQNYAQKITKQSIQELAKAPFIRGNGDPRMDFSQIKHKMTQGEYKNNNNRGGLNHRIALEDCLCAFFNLWDEFKIYKLPKKGAADKDILSVLGYLKLLRNRVTHNRYDGARAIEGISLKYIEYKLPSFSKEERVELSEQDLDAIIAELRRWIKSIIDLQN